MSLSRFLVTFRELPPPIRWSSILYITGGFGYNIFGTYVDSKTYLQKYRNGTTCDSSVTNEWEATKFGANEDAFGRLWDSIVWPINVITNVVPSIVFTLNPPTPKDPPTQAMSPCHRCGKTHVARVAMLPAEAVAKQTDAPKDPPTPDPPTPKDPPTPRHYVPCVF